MWAYCLVCLLLATNVSSDSAHPRHQVVCWTTKYKGTTFRVIKFPHCRHVETIISDNPPGETVRHAKKRWHGFAASTACFYNTKTLLPVDFFRRNGKIKVGREVGRRILAISKVEPLKIQNSLDFLRSKLTSDALALGSLVKPFSLDGFSIAFANINTDRMSLALSPKYLYIVQAKTNLWKMSQFTKERLPCNAAINTDGGHAVKGKSPYHLVFRWKNRSSLKVLRH